MQGFGNVGSISAPSCCAEQGARIVAVTDWKGGVYNAKGLDMPALLEMGGREARPSPASPAPKPLTNDQLFGLDVDILIPAALENQITAENARDDQGQDRRSRAPTARRRPTRTRLLHERGVFVVPDILANAGGVTTSYFEWVQDRHGYFWTEKEVNERLETKMVRGLRRGAATTAKQYNVDMRTAAYIVAINRVATVTRMRGMYA